MLSFKEGDKVFVNFGDGFFWKNGQGVIIRKGDKESLNPISRMSEVKMADSNDVVLIFFGEMSNIIT